MRTVALWMLVALLPLRLWAGDVMAVSMLDAPSSRSALASGPSGAAADCPSHRASAAGGEVPSAADTADVGHGDHETDGHVHTMCDVCHGPAIAAPTSWFAAGPTPRGAVACVAARFASVCLPKGLKPPIARA